MVKKTTSLFLWPILTFIVLHGYKLYVLGGYSIHLTFNIVTDGLLFALIGVLSVERNSKSLQRLQMILVSLFILYDLIDVCVYLAIQNRFTLNNFLGNIEYANVFIYFVSVKMAVLAAVVILIPIIFGRRKIALPFAPSATNILAIEILIVLSIAYYFTSGKTSSYASGDALDLSTNSFAARSVTEDTLSMINTNFSALIQRIQKYFSGKNWDEISKNETEKPNVIVVVSESLSMVDSKYAGGLFDRMPMIDKLQQEGMVFKQTVSNGKITPHGLAAFILGVQTTKTGGYAGMMEQFTPAKFSENNIVKFAKDAGYTTIIISPGQPVSFYQMNEWFTQVGFEIIYNIDSEIFAGTPRFTWDAPSDQAIFDVALKLLPNLKQPYFLVIETVSLHQPYILPDPKYKVGDNDLYNLINYVDGTTYNFYQRLKQQNYFTNGYFVLFGDHRRFEPLEPQEIDDGGYAKWHERIICSIVGTGIPPLSVYNDPFSLVDMNTLLHYIISGQPVNEKIVLQASLSSQLGIDSPFSISLVDDDHGTYLVRSKNAAALYISIFGQVPFDKIPNDNRDAVVYLIQNNQQMKAKIVNPGTRAAAF